MIHFNMEKSKVYAEKWASHGGDFAPGSEHYVTRYNSYHAGFMRSIFEEENTKVIEEKSRKWGELLRGKTDTSAGEALNLEGLI